MRLTVFGWAGWLSLAGLLAACEDCTFTSRNNTEAAIRFYSRRPFNLPPNRQPPVVVQNLAVDSIYTLDFNRTLRKIFPVGAAGVDSLRAAGYDNAALAPAFFLPLNPGRDTAAYVFVRRLANPTRRLADTLWLSYRRQIAVITPNCGFDQQYSQLTVLRHSRVRFDSVAIASDLPQIADSVNIRVYLRP
ncbi:MAG: DUF6452 family protein [Bernardetiaceae bacterium]|nr:DUF6452 family protein [Bernardetiaceae bacterium]